MTTYTNLSPYYNTALNGSYLDILNFRSIPMSVSDILVTIESKYSLRPDIFSHDVYGDSRLWWVFSVRNPDLLIDPIYSFVFGVSIFVPDKQLLFSNLGI